MRWDSLGIFYVLLLYLPSGCVSSCPLWGGYQIHKSECTKCGVPHCLRCSPEHLSECRICEAKHFVDPSSRCSPCTDPKCNICLLHDECIQCKEGYSPNISAICVKHEHESPLHHIKPRIKHFNIEKTDYQGVGCLVKGCSICEHDVRTCSKCKLAYFLEIPNTSANIPPSLTGVKCVEQCQKNSLDQEYCYLSGDCPSGWNLTRDWGCLDCKKSYNIDACRPFYSNLNALERRNQLIINAFITFLIGLLVIFLVFKVIIAIKNS